MTDDAKLENGSKGSATRKLERIGWALFLIFVGVVYYADELGRVTDFYSIVSIIGGGFLLAYWAFARLVRQSLSYPMLVVGTLLLVSGILDRYNIDLEWMPLIIIILGVLLLVKAVTDRNG